MSYKRAEEILPAEIITLIQQYVDGQNIYIPRKTQKRREWGFSTNTRQELNRRNEQIYADYLAGIKVCELADRYFLSVKSIQYIIRKKKTQGSEPVRS
ncbi:MAG: hypothetical protein K2O03_05180 [Lachnospiraceae bacterium]|nr:hypothetical protein [Lachnospiraceae bacterium]